MITGLRGDVAPRGGLHRERRPEGVMMKLWRSVLVSPLLRGGQHVPAAQASSDPAGGRRRGSDETFAQSLGVGGSTVYRTKRHFVEGTLGEALHEEPRPDAKRKLTGQEAALLVATACSRPPEGRARWTIELLAGEMVRLTSTITSRAKPCREIAAWERQRNLAGAHLKWMFTTEKARTKWAAPIPDQPLPSTSPPKSHNHCAEELVAGSHGPARAGLGGSNEPATDKEPEHGDHQNRQVDVSAGRLVGEQA